MMLVKEDTKRPDDGAFFQQRLPAWKPVINIHTTLPVFAVLGVFLIPIGLMLVTTAGAVKEVRLDYSRCVSPEGDACYESHWNKTCACVLEFDIDTKLSGSEIVMYYGFERYYQNHRKYATSRSDKQLRGFPQYQDSSCQPFQSTSTGKTYAPCGLIANTMFNDTFKLIQMTKKLKNDTEINLLKPLEINHTRQGIAWPSDHGVKFKNPAGKDLADSFKGTSKPANWRKPAFQLDPEHASNNAFLNEPFIVWMRVSAFPTFRKLYGRILMEENPQLNKGLVKGKYQLVVQYNYPVLYYNSHKYFVLSTTSVFGSRNLMIGILYLVVGGMLLVISAIFACIVKKDSETAYFSFLSSS